MTSAARAISRGPEARHPQGPPDIREVVASSVQAARRKVAAELAELRRREADRPADEEAAHVWALQCMSQAERYFEAVERVDSLVDELAAAGIPASAFATV